MNMAPGQKFRSSLVNVLQNLLISAYGKIDAPAD